MERVSFREKGSNKVAFKEIILNFAYMFSKSSAANLVYAGKGQYVYFKLILITNLLKYKLFVEHPGFIFA